MSSIDNDTLVAWGTMLLKTNPDITIETLKFHVTNTTVSDPMWRQLGIQTKTAAHEKGFRLPEQLGS